MAVNITNFGATNQILGFIQEKVAFGVLVNDTGVTADSNGRKIIPAGTPVGGTTNALEDETAVLSVVSDATAQGILEHDVDVTDGTANGTMIVHGYINENRIPKSVTIPDAVKKALPNVVFFKRNA